MTTIEIARIFACYKHKEQKYGEFPYVYHLDMVYNNLLKANILDIDLLIAAYLHDLLEDTDTTFQELGVFGTRASLLVEAVTGRGSNRKNRNLDAYQKIKMFGHDAVTLKLADRLANVRASKENNKSKFSMYLKEHKSFKENLGELGNVVLWNSLNKELQY